MDEIDRLLYMPSSEASSPPYNSSETNTPSESQSPVASPVTYNTVYADAMLFKSEIPGKANGEDGEAHAQPAKPAKPKRKRQNRYKNAPPSVLSRRRAQNRASQRAYRERKDQRIKDLETLLAEARQRNESLSRAYSALSTEVSLLRGSTGTDLHQLQQQQQLLLDMGLASFDPNMPTDATEEKLDLDMFVYPELQTDGFTL